MYIDIISSSEEKSILPKYGEIKDFFNELMTFMFLLVKSTSLLTSSISKKHTLFLCVLLSSFNKKIIYFLIYQILQTSLQKYHIYHYLS